MPEITTDPFTAVYDALWTMLTDSSCFTAEVVPGNRVSYTGDARDPKKRRRVTHDYPEVELIVEDLDPHIQRTSSTSTVDVMWAWQIETGERCLDRELFPVIWAIYRASSKWSEKLTGLTWNGDRIVVVANQQSVDTEEKGQEAEKEIAGWRSVWRLQTTLQFTTALLQA